MTIDTTHFLIGGTPPYLFFALIGIIAAMIAFILLNFFSGLDTLRYLRRLAVSSVFLLIGAKLFGIIWNVLSVLKQGEPIHAEVVLHSGIVFYGGMLGLVTAFLFLTHEDSLLERKRARNNLAAIIPLFHCFGRIGCFFTGCCYGMEFQGVFSVLYTNQIGDSVITAQRFPVQLLEAAVNLLLAIVLFMVAVIRKEKTNVLIVYFLTYPPIRFILEYFRGDSFFYSFQFVTFSQLVSIALMAVAVLYIFIQKKKGQKEDG